MSHASSDDPATTAERTRRAALRRWDRRALAVAVVLFGALLFPFLAWQLSPKRRAAVLVVDKTVPHENFREHSGLIWWLDHQRLRTLDGERWTERTGYLGYDPVRRWGATIDSAALAGRRLLYIADSYGVYSGDSLTDPRRPRGAAALAAGLDRSELLYGGIGADEAKEILRFSQRGGAVVAEFNSLESPTWGTPASEVLAAVVGARYDGWLGRWYGDLASEEEIPRWMRERHARLRGIRDTAASWPYTGPGLVLFAEASDRLVVVPERQFVGPHPVTVEVDVPSDTLVAGVVSGRPYWYWFSGVTATPDARVLASYQLHVDSAAARALAEGGFPLRFPAIVRRNGTPLGAYLAGDFADVGAELPYFPRTRFVDAFRRRLAAGRGRPGSPRDSWWLVVTPVWSAMLDLARVTDLPGAGGA